MGSLVLPNLQSFAWLWSCLWMPAHSFLRQCFCCWCSCFPWCFFFFYLKTDWLPWSPSTNSCADPVTPFIREGQSTCHVVKISVVFMSFVYSFGLVYLFIHQTHYVSANHLTFCQQLGCKVKLDDFPDPKDIVWLGRVVWKWMIAVKGEQHHILEMVIVDVWACCHCPLALFSILTHTACMTSDNLLFSCRFPPHL